MAIKLGNTNIGSIYFGSTKISEAYLGSTKIFSSAVPYPYLLIEFDNASYTPSTNLLHANYRSTCTWTRESSSPNVWKLEIHEWNLDGFGLYGLTYLFRPSEDSGSSTLTMDCSLYGSGNMDTELDGHYCQTFDRMFYGATGLTSIEPIHCTTVENVGGMFSGCTNIAAGALDQYDWFSTYAANINNHSGTFTNCGSNTAAGLSELNQIPVGWGGNLIPASTLMTSSVLAYTGTNNKSAWQITGNAPDWTNIIGMYLFTQASVSQYAGVSMNRTRIPNGLNGFGTTQGTYALYFYPAFVQCSKIPGQSGNTVSWIATTDTPNGSITASQGNTDMPGTLDYSTYGPITRVYGTYMSSDPVYFVFLVTNYPITDYNPSSTSLSSIPMAFLWNSGFKTDGGFRYFY